MAKHTDEQWHRRSGLWWWIIGGVLVLLLGAVGGIAASGIIPGFSPFASAATEDPTADATPTRTPPAQPSPTPTPTPSPTPSPTPTDPAYFPCEGATTMSIMAHYDDDLIFANPALTQAIRGGQCVRTVFVTAGDAGNGVGYANSRENGIMKAYNIMRGGKGTWTTHEVDLTSGVHATIMTPDDTTNVSVTFLRLPDGAIPGDGFDATGYESLAKLFNGSISEMHQITTGAAVSLEQLTATIQELVKTYDPATLITLIPGDSPKSSDDHSDHSTVGSLVRDAVSTAGFDMTRMRYAQGYNTGQLPANVEGPDLDIKLDAFIVYAGTDWVSSCSTRDACLNLPTFGASLARQYFLTDAELYQ